MTYTFEDLSEYLLLKNLTNDDGYWVWVDGDLSEDGTLFSYKANRSMDELTKYIDQRLGKTHPGLKLRIADHTFTHVHHHTVKPVE